MRRCGCALVAVVIALSAWAAEQGEKSAADVPAATASTQPAGPADNSYCLTCHMNMNEDLTKQHQKVGIGCANCHGESDKHSSDENNITPPDVMYPASKIYGACVKCHEEEKLIKRAEHDPMFIPRKREQSCTECHGKHKMSVRTRRWDKLTRKLISDDGVRMVQDPPASK